MNPIDPIGQSVENMMTTQPLYTKAKMEGQFLKDTRYTLCSSSETFDQYCPSCKQQSTYRMVATEEPYDEPRFAIGMTTQNLGSALQTVPVSDIRKEAICTRNDQHSLVCYFLIENDGITKIGQFPSLPDIVFANNKQYAKVLGKDQLAQLNKAIGLNAHGVGIGAFIYLRRVFESLVEEGHQLASKTDGWNETAYVEASMQDRIKSLKDYLPRALSSRALAYPVLSDHVHNLSDDKCLANFESVKLLILRIAEEKLYEKNIAEQDQKIDASLNALHSQGKQRASGKG